MRRILAKVTRDDTDLGDISTMADESILEELFATKHIYAAFWDDNDDKDDDDDQYCHLIL